MHKTGRGSTAYAGFGEGGADHLIGVAVEVVGGDEHDLPVESLQPVDHAAVLRNCSRSACH